VSTDGKPGKDGRGGASGKGPTGNGPGGKGAGGKGAGAGAGAAKVPAPRSGTLPAGAGSGPRFGQGVRFAAYLGLFVVGAVVGLAGCFAQALWAPGGLLLALLAAGGLFLAGSRLTGTRLGALWPALGWFVVVLVGSSQRPEGDLLLTSNAESYAYLLVGALVAVICVTVPSSGAGFPGRAGGGRPPRVR